MQSEGSWTSIDPNELPLNLEAAEFKKKHFLASGDEATVAGAILPYASRQKPIPFEDSRTIMPLFTLETAAYDGPKEEAFNPWTPYDFEVMARLACADSEKFRGIRISIKSHPEVSSIRLGFANYREGNETKTYVRFTPVMNPPSIEIDVLPPLAWERSKCEEEARIRLHAIEISANPFVELNEILQKSSDHKEGLGRSLK